MPKISVIMPVYNAEQYLREAIDSILSQTFGDFELIIIDDGSKDSSPAIVERYEDPRIRFYVNEENMGVAKTLNRGLDLATGQYIARMDSDDISLPERFAKQVAYLDAHPEIGILATDVQTFGAQEYYHPTSKTHEQLSVDMLFSCCLCHPTVMMRRSLGLRYDPAFNRMEDYELWIRASQQCRLACYPEILFRYRIHPHQVTQKRDEKLTAMFRSLKLRQIAQFNLTSQDPGFEAFVQRCAGQTPQNLDGLRRFCMTIFEKNAKKQVLDPDLLGGSLGGIILSTFPSGKEKRQFIRHHGEYFSPSLRGRLQRLRAIWESYKK